jgi:adenylyltransferase/sulfurtransferase
MDRAGDEQARFARQLVLPGFSEASQALIRNARVHVVGAGRVGGPALLCLAQAGIGTIYVDDGEDVTPDDGAAWLYPAGRAGEPRLMAALEAVRGASSFLEARPYATGLRPSATLVCASSRDLARSASERARLAGLQHVVAISDGTEAAVVAVPSGAPCFRCASRPSAGRPSSLVAATAGVLGALELVLMLAGAVHHKGRRIDLTAALPEARSTSRVPGCDCVNVY